MNTGVIFARRFQYKALAEPIRTVLSTGGLFPQWYQPPSQPRNARRVLAYMPSVGPAVTTPGTHTLPTNRHHLSLGLGMGFS